MGDRNLHLVEATVLMVHLVGGLAGNEGIESLALVLELMLTVWELLRLWSRATSEPKKPSPSGKIEGRGRKKVKGCMIKLARKCGITI